MFLQKLITGKYKYAEDRYRACGNLDTKTQTIRCKCLMCDGEWDADLYDLRKHYGCPHCSKKDKVIFARQYLLEALMPYTAKVPLRSNHLSSTKNCRVRISLLNRHDCP